MAEQTVYQCRAPGCHRLGNVALALISGAGRAPGEAPGVGRAFPYCWQHAHEILGSLSAVASGTQAASVRAAVERLIHDTRGGRQ